MECDSEKFPIICVPIALKKLSVNDDNTIIAKSVST